MGSPTTPESMDTDTMASVMLMLNQRLMLMLSMDTTDMPDLMPMDTEAMDTHTDTDTMASVMLMLNPRSSPTVPPFPTLLLLLTPSPPPMEVWYTPPWSESAPTTSEPRSLAN